MPTPDGEVQVGLGLWSACVMRSSILLPLCACSTVTAALSFKHTDYGSSAARAVLSCTVHCALQQSAAWLGQTNAGAA